MVTRSSHLLCIAIAATCFFLGFLQPEKPNDFAKDPLAVDRSALETETRAQISDTKIDLLKELADRPALDLNQALDELDAWMRQSNGVIQQFPLYDIVGRVEQADIEALLAHIENLDTEIAREARHVIQMKLPNPPQTESHESKTAVTAAQLSEALRNGPRRGEWLNTLHLIEQFAQQDPRNAWRLIQDIHDTSRLKQSRQVVLQAYATQFPVEAISMLEESYSELPTQADREEASSAFQIALFNDPDGVFNWFRDHPNPNHATRFLIDTLSRTYQKSTNALPIIQLLPNSAQKTQFRLSAIERFALEDISGSLQWINDNLSGKEALDAKTGIIDPIFQYDRTAAFELLDQIVDEQAKRRAAGQIANAWQNEDFNEALSWTLALADPKMRSDAIIALSAKWAQIDPQAAQDYAAQSEDPNIQRTLRTQWVSQMTQSTDPLTLIRSLDQIEDPTFRSALASQALSELSSIDPSQAWEMIQELYPRDSSDYTNQATSLANSWAQTDPQSAAQVLWAQGGPIAQGSLYPIIDSYSHTRPHELIKLVDLLPAADTRLRAIAYTQIAQNPRIRQDFPEIAAQAQARIGN